MQSMRDALENVGFRASDDGTTVTPETPAPVVKKAKPKVAKNKRHKPRIKKVAQSAIVVSQPPAPPTETVLTADPNPEASEGVVRKELASVGTVEVDIPKAVRFMPYHDGRRTRYAQVKIKVGDLGYVSCFVHGIVPEMPGTRIVAHAVVMEKTLPNGQRFVYIDLYPRSRKPAWLIAVVPIGTLIETPSHTWRYALPRPLHRAMIVAGPLDMLFRQPPKR